MAPWSHPGMNRVYMYCIGNRVGVLFFEVKKGFFDPVRILFHLFLVPAIAHPRPITTNARTVTHPGSADLVVPVVITVEKVVTGTVVVMAGGVVGTVVGTVVSTFLTV